MQRVVNEILVGEGIIEVITAEKEFMIDRMEVKPTDFRGPRCILEEMAKDTGVSGLGTWKNLP